MHYLLGSLLLLAVWVIIFWLSKNLRREMLTASIIILPAALSEVFFVPGYWLPDTIGSPKLSIEDFIFTFAIGGIIAICYELVLGIKHFKHLRLCNCYKGEGSLLLIGIFIIFAAYFLVKINFMYAVYIGIIIDILLISIKRSDLIKKIIFSSLIFGIFYFVFFAIFSRFIPGFLFHWNFSALSGIILMGVPLEEIIWAFLTGALIGPIYEYLLGIKLVERR
jgi:hypothetical protein